MTDAQLADLWRDKRNPDPNKKSRLPPGVVSSGNVTQGNAVYDRAALLRWLKKMGIVPDAP